MAYGHGRAEGGMEVGEERLYSYRYAVPALRWVAIRASLMFQCEGQRRRAHRPQLF